MQSTLDSIATSTRPVARPDRIRLARAATGLNPAEKLLLRSLVDFMGNSSECWPSLPRLAAEVGVSTRHIRRMLRSLEAAGWISTEHRFRPDRSQTSCLYRWAKAPDLHVRPPRTSVSALELNIGSIQGIKTHAAVAECGFCEQEQPGQERQKQLDQNDPIITSEVPPICAPSQKPAAAVSVVVNLPPQAAAKVVANLPQAIPPRTASNSPVNCPEGKPARTSPKFIIIDGSKFLDINHGHDIYLAAVAGKLLNSGTADRLAFFACWCAIAGKLRAGTVRAPERMMRFLLDNRKAMSAYPDHAAEQKARAAIRHLWPDKPYNPHG